MTFMNAIPLADTWGMHGDVGSGWMALWMVLFWAAIVLGIVWMARAGARGDAPAVPAARESPVEILERRFAEGAISVEDYHARREVLLHGGDGAGVPS